ncbi:MAG: VOC family protein [Acidobacteria bacterium]|nr:VOC family protein [Acidobacteriota bacterium]
MPISPFARPGRVRLQVADLARSISYYRDVIGLQVRSQDAGRAELAPKSDDDRVLVEIEERRGATPVPRRANWGLYHFALLVPDRAALGRFAAHVLPSGRASGAADHAVSEAIYLSDPDGLGIEVYADRPRERWRRQADGELHMVTAPLDVESLIDEAGGRPWTGAPAGTVMGHVHLHVGDIDQASAFYHDAMGLDRVVWSYPGALFLSAGGYHHHLGVNTWGAARPARDDQARLLSWDLELPDRAAAALVADGLRAHGHPVDQDEVGWTASDPWGTAVRIRTTGTRG